MKKVELVEAIATKAGLTKADAARAFDATLEVIAGNLEKGPVVACHFTFLFSGRVFQRIGGATDSRGV